MFVARWDLDKTYLRTDFDTARELLRTAIERPDQKRTVPGAATLIGELGAAGVQIHILSGSPEQLRGRLVAKLRLDGVRFASLTLKPNLQNLLRLRFRALREQLGYKLTALLRQRCELPSQQSPDGAPIEEVLLGDDAEADAFVYSLYADVCAGVVDGATLRAVMTAGRCYADDVADAARLASYLPPAEVVERILIHLEQQSSPARFARFGPRVVPFYNYLQAAFVLHQDGRLPALSLLRVAQDLVVRERFDGHALARSYLELARRGHLSGVGLPTIEAAYGELISRRAVAAASELGQMVTEIAAHAAEIPPPPSRPVPTPDYLALVRRHNPRRHGR